MGMACFNCAWWATAIISIQAIEDVQLNWIWNREDAGKNCHDVCEKIHFRCEEDAAWPDTDEKMKKIAAQYNVPCRKFCERGDFGQVPVFIAAGEKSACSSNSTVGDKEECVYSKPSLDNSRQARCNQTLSQKSLVCPCTQSIFLPVVTEIEPSVTATPAAEEAGKSVSTTLSEDASLATTTIFKGVYPGTKKKGVFDDMGLGGVDLVSVVVIGTGAAAGIFFISIVVGACICTCRRRRASAERNSRRRERRRARSSRSSRRSRRRNRSRRSREPSPSSASSSRSDSPEEDRRRTRTDQHSAKSHTVIHMAEDEYDDAGYASTTARPETAEDYDDNANS